MQCILSESAPQYHIAIVPHCNLQSWLLDALSSCNALNASQEASEPGV